MTNKKHFITGNLSGGSRQPTKDPDTLKNFTSDFTRGEPYVMFPDSKWAHLMVPVGDYYKYQPESSPSN